MPQIYTSERVKRIVEDETGFEYRLIEVDEIAKRDPLTNKEQKRMMTIEHLECGHRYTLDIYEFIHGKRRCAHCVKGKKLNEHFSFTKEEIISKTNELTNGEYSFVDENYHNANTLHKYKHNICGTIFEKKWSKFKDGQRCPKCYKHGMDSMASGYLQDILEFYNVDYEMEKRFEECINPKTSKMLPFDYFIEKIGLLIEVDGEQHERPSYGKNTFEALKERDKIKDEYARDHGYTLLRIPAKKFSDTPQYAAEILSAYFQKKNNTLASGAGEAVHEHRESEQKSQEN
jgi:hypothetical protein